MINLLSMLPFTARKQNKVNWDDNKVNWDEVCDYAVVGQNTYGMPWNIFFG